LWQDVQPRYVTVAAQGDRIVGYDPSRVYLAFTAPPPFITTPNVSPIVDLATPFGYPLTGGLAEFTVADHGALVMADWFAVDGAFPLTLLVVAVRDERRFLATPPPAEPEAESAVERRERMRRLIRDLARSSINAPKIGRRPTGTRPWRCLE
jgi:hypothetical protein